MVSVVNFYEGQGKNDNEYDDEYEIGKELIINGIL